jgi:hypothetical protein
MAVPDEVLWEIEDRLGVEIRGGPMAYEGKEGCDDLMCRRMMGPNGPDLARCMGWHCAVCHAPTSMYGHDTCREGE